MEHHSALLMAALLGATSSFAQTVDTAASAAAPASVAAPAAAAPASQPSASSWDPSIKRVGITVSPIHFVLGFEGAIEFLPTPKLGVVGLFGTGSVEAADLKFSWTEIGAQARYYFGGNGKGFHLGAEVMNINVELDESSSSVDAMAGGLAIGPLLGWKGVWGTGFTFCVQGGYQYMSVDAKAESGDASAEASNSGGIPLLNLDFGWSF